MGYTKHMLLQFPKVNEEEAPQIYCMHVLSVSVGLTKQQTSQEMHMEIDNYELHVAACHNSTQLGRPSSTRQVWWL